MSTSEEDTYSAIFGSLKHPIRRKILRMLALQPASFSDLQKQVNIESPLLTYHLEGLGSLLVKTNQGKYELSLLGQAAVSTMKNVEETPAPSHFPFTGTRSIVNGKKVVTRALAIALGIVCIVLAATLVGAFAYYVPMINDKNNMISSLSTQISQLESNVTNLQNQISSDHSTIDSIKANITHLQDQLNGFLTPAFNVGLIASAPDNWENETVVVEGKLSGPLAYFTTISWYYELSTNGTVLAQTELGTDCIGVDLGARGRYYSAEDVFVIGTVKKGIIGTITGGEQPTVSYYIEAWFVVPR